MVPHDQDDSRPRRARESQPDQPADDAGDPQHEPGVDASADGDPRSDQAEAAEPSVEETVARARHAERVNELRAHRDRTGSGALPERGDRPDVGHRRNVTLDQEAAGGRRRGPLVAVLLVLVAAVIAAGVTLYVTGRDTAPTADPGRPQTPAPKPVPMVGPDTLLSEADAAQIDDRSWTVDSDQPGIGDDAPVPACLSRPAEGEPQPTGSIARTLVTDDSGPRALHRAQAYQTPELATEAFALAAKSLGECDLKGGYIQSGRVISGLGDEATGIQLTVPGDDSRRAVLLNRTGRVVNVLDVVQQQSAPSVDGTAAALAAVTDSQCTIAVGLCASAPAVADGPPPIGGDQPGFLAYADLPLPKNGKGTWGGLPPGSPADVVTSQCEDVDFNELEADNRTARSYVLTDAPKGVPDAFGIDEIVLSMAGKKAAQDQADAITENIADCEDRQPTATVGAEGDISGTGAGGIPITGSVITVSQQVEEDEQTAQYRVGVAVAGNKLIYTFLPYEGDWNVTRDQWKQITVRAAQRASQVR